MDRKFLENLGLEKEVIDKVLDQNMAEIGKQKDSLKLVTEERDTLKNQLTEANAQIEQFNGMDIEGIKKASEEWKAKYETDKADWEKQLADRDYTTAAQNAVLNVKFTSESAKKAFLTDLKAKGLPLQDGKLLGFDDFKKIYAESDPYAFAGDKPVPTITVPGGPAPVEITKDLFEKMTYTEKAKLKQEQPDVFRGLLQK